MSYESEFLPMILEFFRDEEATGTYQQYTSVYNLATSENEETQVDTTVKVILLDIDRTSNGFSTKFGTLVNAGDKEVWILPPQKADPLATPLVPNPAADRITIAGITYKIVVIKEANPTGSNVLVYNAMLRR